MPIENVVMRIDENGEEIMKPVSYRLQFIDRARFMASLSSLVNNLAEGIHKIKYANCNTCCLEYTIAKDHLD